MAGIKESKPKILNTIDGVIANLQAEETVLDTEWQAVMIARECLASSSVKQLADAIAEVGKRLQSTAQPSASALEPDKCPKCGSTDPDKKKQKCWHNPHPWHLW